MEKDHLVISRATKEKVANLALNTGLSTDKLAEVLLEAFADGHGRVYVGKWKEGPGIRLLPDWPRFSSTVVKVKEQDMR